ncbi:MAG TPA: hypothetical protein PK808_07120 [Polymorphobacter sp.]|nr:hypothetical protein [Polymorphobacter sp.]
MRFLRILTSWLIAVIVTTVGISVIHSLRIQTGLAELGVILPFMLRLSTIGRDLVGLAPTLGPVVAIALAIGFTVAAFLRPRLPALAWIAYPLAGGAAIVVALVAMHYSYDITPIAGARGPLGLPLFGLVGAVGGWIFAWRIKSRG